MPAPSPASGADALVSFAVELAGSPIPDTAKIFSVHAGSAAGRPATASVTLLASLADLPALVASPWLAPGRPARIAAGYAGQNQTIFAGRIARLVLASPAGSGAITLAVECTGPATAAVAIATPVLSLTLGQDVLNFQLTRASARSGLVRCAGSSAVRVGDRVTLAGFGAGFDGDLPVRGLTHEIRDGLWTTTLELRALA